MNRITAYGMKMMNGEDIRIVFSTGPYDYGDDGIDDIVIIDGLDRLTFEDVDELENLKERYRREQTETDEEGE